MKIVSEFPHGSLSDEVSKAVKARARVAPGSIEWITEGETTAIWFSDGSRKPKRFWDNRATPSES
jgi:hypothetical protein